MKKLFVLLLVSVVMLSGCGESKDEMKKRHKRELDQTMRDFEKAYEPMQRIKDARGD